MKRNLIIGLAAPFLIISYLRWEITWFTRIPDLSIEQRLDLALAYTAIGAVFAFIATACR